MNDKAFCLAGIHSWTLAGLIPPKPIRQISKAKNKTLNSYDYLSITVDNTPAQKAHHPAPNIVCISFIKIK
jgi:hypothetical protein